MFIVTEYAALRGCWSNFEFLMNDAVSKDGEKAALTSGTRHNIRDML